MPWNTPTSSSRPRAKTLCSGRPCFLRMEAMSLELLESSLDIPAPTVHCQRCLSVKTFVIPKDEKLTGASTRRANSHLCFEGAANAKIKNLTEVQMVKKVFCRGYDKCGEAVGTWLVKAKRSLSASATLRKFGGAWRFPFGRSDEVAPPSSSSLFTAIQYVTNGHIGAHPGSIL